MDQPILFFLELIISLIFTKDKWEIQCFVDMMTNTTLWYWHKSWGSFYFLAKQRLISVPSDKQHMLPCKILFVMQIQNQYYITSHYISVQLHILFSRSLCSKWPAIILSSKLLLKVSNQYSPQPLWMETSFKSQSQELFFSPSLVFLCSNLSFWRDFSNLERCSYTTEHVKKEMEGKRGMGRENTEVWWNVFGPGRR